MDRSVKRSWSARKGSGLMILSQNTTSLGKLELSRTESSSRDQEKRSIQGHRDKIEDPIEDHLASDGKFVRTLAQAPCDRVCKPKENEETGK